ncbi:ATP-binding cassette domain-containing protein [Macrococcus hajekii]|uniref:ATP-binding cassette domain-containing protein n=1 Tax=Macrococcus hajekii TaxID=198482 RepID=A0A4R6BNR4_9STAP|nr:ATP-binding cassette domain-containing protein [Macrococcus hajekii]TDM03513.1 ATP-binding cassette domain-containing protein [Macrococcus hajekii]GGA99440.1 methionine import ATP-binding protein MetN 2 [Macrococcus hajekii]
MITLNEVVKQFTTKKGSLTAVDHVNMTINEGEIFGVIGFSGAGKSTLIRMFNGLEKPTSGDVVVGGDNIAQLSPGDLRKKRQKIGMIFQHFNLLWSRTVFDNIAFPLEIAGVAKADRTARVNELIRMVGLEGRENAYPSQLSGGQKQRVGIARALANNPTVLLCDEATSALDPQTTDEILDLLVNINKELKLTIILITHEMQVIRKICHQVAVMENGRVVEQGPVMHVFENPQSSVTQRFVKDDLKDSELETSMNEIMEHYPTGTILRLKFVGSTSGQPIISKMIRKYNLDANVLAGNIKHTQNGSFGHLIVHVPTLEGHNEMFKELSEHGVQAEVERHG